jgi:hypothetical protein
MLRLGLALYLVFSTAVGPSLCCCLPGDLLALFNSAKQTSSAHHRSCGHPACDRDHPSKKSKGVPGDPSPAPHRPCPCKEACPEPLVFLAAGHASGAEYGRSLEAPRSIEAGWFLLPASSMILPAQGQLPTQPITCSWHDPRDILRALHILRC